MTTADERWPRVRELFDELVEVPHAEQVEALDRLTGADAPLRPDLESLLAAERAVGDRFERLPNLPDDFGELDAVTDPAVGTRIGPYRIAREIGRGGMGAVYEAFRDDDAYTKRVAIKMVPVERVTEPVLRRFHHERQILARLEHKNIAGLLDGGVTGDGRPWFAMECIEGERIDHWCDRQHLGVRERLQLIRQVCAAVHYAHQKLVIHRDLKPSNVLVGPNGTVKLLDFGIAKLVDPEEPDRQLTETGALPMTTSYASPEQLRGQAVSTASDIYSLGVLMYELLAGRPPFLFGNLAILEIRRLMLEETPLAPSLVADRHTAPTAGLTRTMAGELDQIVLMALRKEPHRRYASAEQLSDDLARFLVGQPVRAQPDSLGYRARKFAARNRAAVAAVGVIFLTLLGGLAVTLWQVRTSERERARAELERAKATQVAAFFSDLFVSASPEQLGRQVTVVEAIEAAIPRIDSAFADQPGLRAALKGTVGSTLYNMGLKTQADPLLRAALAEQEALDSGRTTEPGATALFNVAMLEQDFGRLGQAESLYRRSMAMYETLPEMTPADIARGWGQVSTLLSSQGRHAEAIELQGRVVDLLRARLPQTDRALWIAIANYGAALTELGRLEEGERQFREAITLTERYRGPESDDVGGMLQPLAMNLMFAGQLVAAESVARRSYRIARTSRGAANTTTLASLRAVISVLIEQGRCPEAIPLARGIIALRGGEIPDTDPSIGTAYVMLGQCLGMTGDALGGEEAIREGTRLRVAVFPPDHWVMAHTRSLLGEVLARGGKTAEGQQLLDQGYRGLLESLGAENIRTRQSKERLDRWRGTPARRRALPAPPAAPTTPNATPHAFHQGHPAPLATSPSFHFPSHCELDHSCRPG